MYQETMLTLKEKTKGQSADYAAALFVTAGETVKHAYVKMAKLIVLIEAKLPKGTKLYPFLTSRGAAATDIANGKQLSRVWKEYVDSLKMSETIFDSLGFLDAVAIHKVAKVHGEPALLALKWDLKKIRELASRPTEKEGDSEGGENEEPPAGEESAPLGKWEQFEALCQKLEESALDILTGETDEGIVEKVHEKIFHVAQAVTEAADQVSDGTVKNSTVESAKKAA